MSGMYPEVRLVTYACTGIRIGEITQEASSAVVLVALLTLPSDATLVSLYGFRRSVHYCAQSRIVCLSSWVAETS